MLLSDLQRIAKLDAGGIAFQRKFNISEKSNVIQPQERHWGKKPYQCLLCDIILVYE